MSKLKDEDLEFLFIQNELNKRNGDVTSKRLHGLRKLGMAIFDRSLDTQPNDATCLLMERNLQEYCNLVKSSDFSKMWADIGLSEEPIPQWNSNLMRNSQTKNNHPEYNCMDGKYEDCKNNEITEEELRVAFKREISINKNQTSSSSLLSVSPKNSSYSINKEIKFNFSSNERKRNQNFSLSPDKPEKSFTPAYSGLNSNKEIKFNFSSNERKRNVLLATTNKQEKVDNVIKTEFRTGLKKPYNVKLQSHKNKFVSPLIESEECQTNKLETPNNDRLKNIDSKMVELIESEIMSNSKPVTWEDICGLEYAKTTITEAVIFPFLRPDLFTGLRRPCKGILLFGPPGTGKTLLGQCIASQSKATFFSISASTLTSKFVGEGEKMVKALFTVASARQPSVIFIDEIDSLFCKRSESEHESSRRIKTEFLVHLDGLTSREDDRVLVVGATNRPQELDEAYRRRFERRLYIPLPEPKARMQIFSNLLAKGNHCLTEKEIYEIGLLTDGYSGADIKIVCQEAAMAPIRQISGSILLINVNDVRPVNFDDFQFALKRVRASVSPNDLTHYIQWNQVYGSDLL